MTESMPSLIHQAISREDYLRALALWDAYAAGLRVEIDRNYLDRQAMSEARDLFESSSLVLRCARAHLQARWHQARSAAAYLQRNPPAAQIRKSL
jgi:hypothetical protein